MTSLTKLYGRTHEPDEERMPFQDLEWDAELAHERRQARNRQRRSVNLSAQIEEYLQHYS